MKSLASTIATIWRLSVPYFRSDDRWPGRVLLASVIAIELSLVAIQVILNQWYNRFYNTLQDHDWNAFVSAILFFCGIAAVYTVLAVYQLYLNQWLQIRWRRWMTQTYLRQWLQSANHYRMQLLGDTADNPDQRIADDLQMFVQYTLTIGIGLLSSIVTLFSFVVILWNLSVHAPLTLFGANLGIPGYLVWAALIYAVIGTALTHLIGWRLIPLNFQQQRFEADFRFNLVRTRENAEQIAALGGEAAERERHLNRFGNVVANWLALMQRQKQLTFFTQSYSQASVIFPYIVVSPAYFSGAMQLGGLMQTASAFNSVQNALSYFITAYRQIAEWRAVIARLTGFEEAIAAGEAAAVTPPAVELVPRKSGAVFAVDRLNVRLPGGEPIVAAEHIAFPAGERVLVTGPSGSGKSTLFRAITGIWPFGSGQVMVPEGAKVMLAPQRPYFPLATLATAVGFPAEAGTFDDARVAEALVAVGLPQLVGRLGEEAHWNRLLSQGEQQRLAIARALLHAPDYLFLDEATAALDEAAEAVLYRLLQDRLKDTTIISIGHRSTLNAFHGRRIELVPGEAVTRVQEVPLASAAE
ncbi:MAG: ABC transporter ATP-binding protein/permease [Xanthobacteraceae bacterium]|nr:ABC transporter ATP-binding protein/permease [Xanthobacteraceae bacterium]